MKTRSWVAAGFLIIVSLPVYAETLTAQLDRDSVDVGETFNLILTLDSKTANVDPDAKPLMKNFEILGTAKSSELTIINNKTTAQTHWIYTLVSKHPGTIAIPALQRGNLHSQALTIIVVAADKTEATHKKSNSSRLFIEATANPTNPYVQSQVIYTVRVYTKDAIQGGTLTDPVLSNTIVTRIGDGVSYQTTRNGQRYGVIERRFAIFPQQSGTLAITPPVLTAQVTDMTSKIGNLGGFVMAEPRSVQMTAPTVQLSVQALPANYHQGQWLPAQQLTLSEDWSGNPKELHAGEPITRVISITTKGLTGEQLSPPDLGNIANVHVYPSSPVVKTLQNERGMQGTRSDKVAYIPSQAGEITFPAITVHWWNTVANREEITTLPAHQVTVLPASQTKPAVSPNTLPSISISTPNASPPGIATVTTHRNYWPWIALAIGLIWLLTLFAWWYQKRQPQLSTGQKSYWLQIKAARTLQQTRDALLAWANATWPDKSYKSLGQIINELNDSPLKAAIRVLNQLLYADQVATWDAKVFWEIFKANAPRNKGGNGGVKGDSLPPIYPQ